MAQDESIVIIVIITDGMRLLHTCHHATATGIEARQAQHSTGALGFCLQPPMSYAMASYMYSQNNLELERFVLPSFSGESGASPAAQFCEYMHEVIA